VTLTDQIAKLWAASTPPTALPTTRLPQLPKPLGCPLDHRIPANWKYTADPHGRAGFRRVTCRSCGRFWGYDTKPDKLKRPKR